MERCETLAKLAEIYQDPLRVHVDYTLHQCTRYTISMENHYLDSRGNATKRQKLTATFERTIEAVLSPILALTGFRWKTAIFSQANGTNPWSGPLPWTFVNDLDFHYYFLYLLNKTEQEVRDDKPFNELQKVIQEQVSFASYSKLPKLPASYLVIMQTFDILGFEVLCSYIHSAPELLAIGKPAHLTFLSNSEAKIGFGLYSDASTFKNGDFYVTYLGYGLYDNRLCSIFEFECVGSQVQMIDDKVNREQKGSSYYQGLAHVDFETGSLVKVKMLESYQALRQSTTNPNSPATPVHVRRHVHMELCNS